jgi:hypothetical protein
MLLDSQLRARLSLLWKNNSKLVVFMLSLLQDRANAVVLMDTFWRERSWLSTNANCASRNVLGIAGRVFVGIHGMVYYLHLHAGFHIGSRECYDQ